MNPIENFENIIAEIISAGASDRSQAIAWLQETDEYYFDLNYMECEFGLPINYLKR